MAYMETTEQNPWPRLLKSEVTFVDPNVFDTNFRTCFGDERILHGEKLAVLLNFKDTESFISCGWTELSR